MFNFTVSIVRLQLIKAKSLPSWQAKLWAFIHERAAVCRLSQVSTGLPTSSCFPRFPWSEAPGERSLLVLLGQALMAELAMGLVLLFRGQNSPRTRSWEGLCSCEVWALSPPCL